MAWPQRRELVRAAQEHLAHVGPTESAVSLLRLLADDPKWEVRKDVADCLLLVPDDSAFHDALVSRVSGSPLLRLDVMERHPYTTFYRLTYEFPEGADRSFAPDAHIRLYRDAHLAEATSYNPAQGFRRTAHHSFSSGCSAGLRPQ